MFFWRKERQVQQAIEDYLVETEHCVSGFAEAMETYLDQGLGKPFEALVEKVHLRERAADDRRRAIETQMYDKALIPESRGDILGMLEALDLIPNQCESVLYQIWTQKLVMPSQFIDTFRDLVLINIDSYRETCHAMRDLLSKIHRIVDRTETITDKEAMSDDTERTLIRAIFDAEIDKADKILFKELVLEIGSISDRAENAADRLRNIAAKRQS